MVEIPLVSYLAKPAKTEAVVLLVRDWLRARSRQILAVGVAVMGVFLLSSAMGSA
jgi:Sap, sulfolipid-1-addressing protein